MLKLLQMYEVRVPFTHDNIEVNEGEQVLILSKINEGYGTRWNAKIFKDGIDYDIIIYEHEVIDPEIADTLTDPVPSINPVRPTISMQEQYPIYDDPYTQDAGVDVPSISQMLTAPRVSPRSRVVTTTARTTVNERQLGELGDNDSPDWNSNPFITTTMETNE